MGYSHNDVKPSNIFIDNSGSCFLGDYRSVRLFGTGVLETTEMFVPRDADVSYQCEACRQLDYSMLAVTLLGNTGHLELTPYGGPLMADISAAVSGIENEQFKSLLDELLAVVLS